MKNNGMGLNWIEYIKNERKDHLYNCDNVINK